MKVARIRATVQGIKTYLVALIHQLMSSSNSLETIHVVELGGNLVPKEPSRSSRTDGPGVDILWVTPDQVAERTLMRDFLSSGYHPDLIDSPNFRAETAVHTENCAIHNGCEDEEVKDLTASLPN